MTTKHTTTTTFTNPFSFLTWLIILISATLFSSNAAVVVSTSSTSHQKQDMTRAAPNDNNGNNYYELKKPMHTICTSNKMSTTTLPEYLVQYADSILPKLEQSSSGGSVDTELKRALDLYRSKYGGTTTYEQEREAYKDFVTKELAKSAVDPSTAKQVAAAVAPSDAAAAPIIMCYSAIVPTFCVFIIMWFLMA